MRPIISVPSSANKLLVAVPSYYRLAADLLLPPPFKISPNRSGVFEDEVDCVIQARAAGANDSEVRSLISNLVAQRLSDYKNNHRNAEK